MEVHENVSGIRIRNNKTVNTVTVYTVIHVFFYYYLLYLHFQELLSTTKNFGDAYDSIHQKLASIKERFHAADGLQPDLLTKKSQAYQFKVSTVFKIKIKLIILK